MSERAEDKQILEQAPGRRKFVRDILFSNLPVPFMKIRTYLWLLIFSRYLGVAGYGEWIIFNITLGICIGLASINFGSAMARFLSGDRDPAEIDRAWSTVLVTCAAAALLVGGFLLALTQPLARLILGGEQAASVRPYFFFGLLAFTLLNELLFEEVKGFLRARRLNKTWAFLTLAKLFPETALTLFAAFYFKDVHHVIVTYALCSICFSLAGILYIRKKCALTFVRPDKAIFLRYASFGVALLPGGLAYYLASTADRYLVSSLLGLEAVGIYGAAVTISGLVFFLVGPINDVLFPELSHLHDSGAAQAFVDRFSGIQKFVLGFSVGIASLLALHAPGFLRIFTSMKFQSGSSTLAIMGTQGLCLALLLLYSVVMNVRLRVWTMTCIWVAMAGSTLGLDLLLIPRLGISGAAISQLVSAAGGLTTLVLLNWTIFRRSFRLVWVAQLGVAVAATFGMSRLVVNEPVGLARGILAITAGFLAYVVALRVSGFVKVRDLRNLVAEQLKR